MFTFGITPVKFVGLLVMFAFCTVWCVYELTRPQDRRQRVSNVLHLVMAVVMLAMVPTMTWSVLAGVVGIPVLVALFGASSLWFVWLAVGSRGDRAGALHHAGHAAMFAAMTWHLAAMGVKRAAMTSGQPMNQGGGSGMGGTGAGGMGGMSGQAAASGAMWVFAIVGVPFMIYLLAAGVQALRRAAARAAVSSDIHALAGVSAAHEPGHLHAAASDDQEHAHVAASCHEVRPVGSPRYRLGALSDAAMNLGMFWMSTGLLVPLLPFMTVFAI